MISEEVTGLRSQLERARAEKENVEEALSEAQVMLAQEQREHRSLAQSRAREAELWTDEREKSLSLVEEMTKEVRGEEKKKCSFTFKQQCETLFLLANVLLRFHFWINC